jgi:hypothetical protein
MTSAPRRLGRSELAVGGKVIFMSPCTFRQCFSLTP